jgi:hypothetical protein
MKVRQLNKEEIEQKAKVFFHSQKWKNLLVFLVFVALVFCFWILQYFQQKIEREISIPIRYTQVPSEIILSDSLPDKITLRLADKGTVFIKYFFENDLAAININLENLPLDRTSYTIEKYTLNGQIRELLLKTTQLLSFSPETIPVRYFPLEKKEVSVRVDGKITTAAGYMFRDSLHINPSKIWIYGDKQTLDSIQFIKTAAVKEENIQKKLNLTINLMVPKGVQLSTEKTKITADIEEYTEKIFELPILCYNLPNENIHVRFFPSTVEVVCQLALSEYSKLSENDLKVGMDYRELSQNPGMNTSLTLSRKPQWLVHYRIVPETVEYLIEQKRDL